ncbi:MAG TPA: glycosyltransferase family 39 protein, partial [Aggregatilineaceae bacterium]|nr:glycosyltransferase family 39 protein [Aggregatilineaceae bacterium]
MADWLQPTLLLLPFAAWMFLGVGIPWALALLPREVWRERVAVLAVGMALGPVGLTAVMFALGTADHITLRGTLIGSAALAALGAGVAWRRRGPRHPASSRPASQVANEVSGRAPLASPGISQRAPRAALLPRDDAGTLSRLTTGILRGESLLIAGIVLLVALNVIVVAYWPFIAYDTQWVYGYNARIFILQGRIPSSMGYYPQLLPLGYTYMQQAWGTLGHTPINDHAARVIVPGFNSAMILMAYVLGWRVFGKRRVGLLTAATWAFYPHVAAWSGAGDLEIPLALYMTGAAAFFIDAWRTEQARYAVLSGLLLGGALWTKPTAGALALGMMLAVAGQAVIARLRWAAWWPKLRIALIAGAASAPIGGMWYLRNLLLGHTAVVFPASYWHSFAQRSGQEFGWPLLIAALVAGGLVKSAPHRGHGEHREEQGNNFNRNFLGSRWLLPLLALVLLLAGTLPTALDRARITQGDNLWQWVRGDLSARGRLGPLDWLLIAAGFGLLAWLGRKVWRGWPRSRRETVRLLWALLLPYGVVWFLDFSYHYRLSFAIVPLVAVQVAALIDGWLWDCLAGHRIGRAAGSVLAVGVIAVAAGAGVQHSAQVWLHGGLPDDTAKYDRGNPGLMAVVHLLERQSEALGRPLVVAIPAEDRLPFFFPTWEIRNSRDADKLPTRLEDLAG